MPTQTKLSNRALALSPPVQRMTFFSAKYRIPFNAQNVRNQIENQVRALDNDITPATNWAKKDVSLKGKKKTKHQLQYLRRRSAANWGYCIEEKLDILARAKGWKTQVTLKHPVDNIKSRPDYYKKISGYHVYVDLTSRNQSGFGGPHIEAKLNKVDKNVNRIIAADIVYDSAGAGNVKISKRDQRKIDKKNRDRAERLNDNWVPKGVKDDGTQNILNKKIKKR